MSTTELDALRREIAELRGELRDLQRLNAPKRVPLSERQATNPEHAPAEPTPQVISRRHALRTAGAVTAGAVAGGLATIATAAPAAATPGSFSGDPVALQADAQNGTGLVATSIAGSAIVATTSAANNPAIDAQNPNSCGVAGQGAIGVFGEAMPGGTIGVLGTAGATVSGTGGKFTGPTGATVWGTDVTVQFQPSNNPAPVASSAAHNQGALIVDNAGALWYCVTSGTPGTWRQLSGATTAGAYHPVTPGRVYDSRCAQPSPGAISSGSIRLLSVAAQRNITTGAVTNPNFIPANATAVFANVAVVNTVDAGYLTINPGGVTTISASTINWGTSNQTQSNGVSLTLDNARQVTVIAGGPGATDFLIDVFGYWL